LEQERLEQERLEQEKRKKWLEKAQHDIDNQRERAEREMEMEDVKNSIQCEICGDLLNEGQTFCKSCGSEYAWSKPHDSDPFSMANPWNTFTNICLGTVVNGAIGSIFRKR
jgi:hypothetical protein